MRAMAWLLRRRLHSAGFSAQNLLTFLVSCARTLHAGDVNQHHAHPTSTLGRKAEKGRKKDGTKANTDEDCSTRNIKPLQSIVIVFPSKQGWTLNLAHGCNVYAAYSVEKRAGPRSSRSAERDPVGNKNTDSQLKLVVSAAACCVMQSKDRPCVF